MNQLEEITLSNFKLLFKSGIDNISHFYNNANRINVFPVADNDTGSNLHYTLNNGINSILNSETLEVFIKELSVGISRYSVGNSGKIISLFFEKSFEQLMGQPKNCMNFHKAHKKGISEAWDYLEETGFNPVKGTILSAISESLNFDYQDNFLNFFTQLYDKAIIAVKETMKDSELLTRANVVDSGALMFLYMVEGWYNCFSEKPNHFSGYDNMEIVNFHRPSKGSIEIQFKAIGNINKLGKLLSNHGGDVQLTGENLVSGHVHPYSEADAIDLVNKLMDYEPKWVAIEDMSSKKIELKSIYIDPSQKVFLLYNGPKLPKNIESKYLNVSNISGKTFVNGEEISKKVLKSRINEILDSGTTITSAQPSASDYNTRLSKINQEYEQLILIPRTTRIQPCIEASKFYEKTSIIDPKTNDTSIIQLFSLSLIEDLKTTNKKIDATHKLTQTYSYRFGDYGKHNSDLLSTELIACSNGIPIIRQQFDRPILRGVAKSYEINYLLECISEDIGVSFPFDVSVYTNDKNRQNSFFQAVKDHFGKKLRICYIEKPRIMEQLKAEGNYMRITVSKGSI